MIKQTINKKKEKHNTDNKIKKKKKKRHSQKRPRAKKEKNGVDKITKKDPLKKFEKCG